MRDGNGLVSRAPEHEIFVLRLPMRDGNHFYGAGEGFALPFLDYLRGMETAIFHSSESVELA